MTTRDGPDGVEAQINPRKPYNPLRFNQGLLQKMDDILPQMEDFLEELACFRKGLGNGEWDAPWWPKQCIPPGDPGYD